MYQEEQDKEKACQCNHEFLANGRSKDITHHVRYLRFAVLRAGLHFFHQGNPGWGMAEINA
jgi:hypothetical protein